MADQIILLRDGRIEQAGTPAEIYERPASEFVARFIGSPPMNVFLNGSGSKLGIRPEHITLHPAPVHTDQSATVETLEYMGADTIVTLRAHAGHTLAARVAGRAVVKPGDRVSPAWAASNQHHFDARTGHRLPPSPL